MFSGFKYSLMINRMHDPLFSHGEPLILIAYVMEFSPGKALLRKFRHLSSVSERRIFISHVEFVTYGFFFRPDKQIAFGNTDDFP